MTTITQWLRERASQSHQESDEKRTNTNTDGGIDKKAYEGDIVSRLKNWRGLHLAHGGDLFEEAAAEIERLRNGAAAGCETVCPHVRGTVTQHCALNFTITDEEREAIEFFADIHCDDEPPHEFAATLRSLLERLQ